MFDEFCDPAVACARSATSCSRRRPFARCAGGFRTRISPTSSSRRRRRSSRQPASRRGASSRRGAAASAGCSRDLALGRRLRARRFDLAIDFHGGPRASLLTWLSGAPVRIGYEVAGRSWMYTRRVARPRELRPRHSVVNQWDLLAALDIAPPDPSATPVEMPARSRRRRGRRPSVSRGAGVVDRRSARRHPRQRRQPVPALAVRAFRRADRGARGRRLRAPHHRHLGSVGRGGGRARDRGRARSRLGAEAATRVLSCGEFSLTELRALLDRAALYIGGDSGPLHIAATTPRADRRPVRPDAAGAVGAVAQRRPMRPNRSMPAACRAGRATSASASRATSAASR